MDDTDARIAKGKTSVLSDLSAIARRKRMEIRRFKKLASSSQLLHDGPLSFENSEVCLKRPRIGQTTMEFANSSEDRQKNTTLSLTLHTEEDRILPLSNGNEAIQLNCVASLNDIGLLRFKSLPPMNILVNEARHSRCNTDVDKGLNAESKELSACLVPRTLKEQIADSSSTEATHILSPPSALSNMVDVTKTQQIGGSYPPEAAHGLSPPSVPSSMVDMTKHLEKESSKAEHHLLPCRTLLENDAALLGPIVGTSDTEMVDLANQSCSHGVGLSTSQTIDSASQVPSDCNFPPSGKLLVCGRRREMEDAATIAPSFTQLRCDAGGSCLCNGRVENQPLCNLHFFAVYDGHGGSQASNFCMENLHFALAQELSSMQEGKDEPSEGSSASSAWERAMISSFSKMDREVGGVCPNGLCDDVDSTVSCCSDSIAPENVGTTAVVAVVSFCQIVVANCGDSRAVLSRGGVAIPLSRDHKPNRDDEHSRIEAAGGRVIYWDGHRVGGLLALSRAIGDRYLKRYVISKPEVTCLQRTEEDECLILASDGLWDVISNDTACEIARKCLDSSRRKRVSGTFALGEDPACAAVAALLIKLAYGRGSKDNISAIVIDLKA